MPVTRPAQHAACERLCALPVINAELSVDNDEGDAFRVLIRIIKRRTVAHGLRVEDSNVRISAFAQQAAILQADTRGGQASHLVDGFFECEQMLVAGVTREGARVRTPAARVAFGGGARAVCGTRAASCADGDEWRARCCVLVV